MKCVRDQKSQTYLGAPRQKPSQQETTCFSVARLSPQSVTVPCHAPQVPHFSHTTQHVTRNGSENVREVLQMATDGARPPEQ